MKLARDWLWLCCRVIVPLREKAARARIWFNPELNQDWLTVLYQPGVSFTRLLYLNRCCRNLECTWLWATLHQLRFMNPTSALWSKVRAGILVLAISQIPDYKWLSGLAMNRTSCPHSCARQKQQWRFFVPIEIYQITIPLCVIYTLTELRRFFFAVLCLFFRDFRSVN